MTTKTDEPVKLPSEIGELLDMIDTLCTGLEWNIENHPEMMNEADSEALAEARALLARYGSIPPNSRKLERPATPDDIRLDAPAQVGNTRFGKGIKWSTVIGAAQRHHEYKNTPEREAERIKLAKYGLQHLSKGEAMPSHIECYEAMMAAQPAASAEPRPDQYEHFTDWYQKGAPIEREVTMQNMAYHGWMAGMRFADMFPLSAPVAAHPTGKPPLQVAAQPSVPPNFSIEDALRKAGCHEGSDGFQISYDDIEQLEEIVRLKLAPTPPAAEQAQQDGYGYHDGESPPNSVLYQCMAPYHLNLCRGQELRSVIDYGRLVWRRAHQDAHKADALLQLIDEFRERLPSSFLTLVDAARAAKGEA